MDTATVIMLVAGALVVGGGVAVAVSVRSAVKVREELAGLRKRTTEAEKAAEEKTKEAILEAKEEAHRLRTEIETETRERRLELQRTERRLVQREETLDRRQQALEKRERRLAAAEQETERLRQELLELQQEERVQLERISGMDTIAAKELILRAVEREARHEMAMVVREIEEKSRREAEREARKIVALAIQRFAADQTIESTVSVVPLPNEDMKGRIIGREGRNIRIFEGLTGVDLIVDDTPEAVVISGFDPMRREIARMALETLLNDGRIHPGRIEEVVTKAKGDMRQMIIGAGEQACIEAGVSGVPPPVVEMLGRLKYRTSYGQNALGHSVEVAHFAGMMAEELGTDAVLARRGGLFHDIGKAVSHEVPGTHINIATELLRRHGESEALLHIIEAHHEDVSSTSVEAVLVQAADAISSSRPGARRDSLEVYVQRLQQLEKLADSFEGVEKAFAIQAGREIRIVVKPDEIDDLMAMKLARDVSHRIEQEVQYPGEIKVTVIRETRAVDYAR